MRKGCPRVAWVTDSVEVADWVRAYVESHHRVAGMLMGIRRRGERANACLKVLVNAAASLTSLAPEAISAPSAGHASSLAEIAGAAWAARGVISGQHVNLGMSPDPGFVAWLARRSSARGGQLAPALMAASDGEMKTLLYEARCRSSEPVCRLAGPPMLLGSGSRPTRSTMPPSSSPSSTRPRDPARPRCTWPARRRSTSRSRSRVLPLARTSALTRSPSTT
jgi:hypothetical protein